MAERRLTLGVVVVAAGVLLGALCWAPVATANGQALGQGGVQPSAADSPGTTSDALAPVPAAAREPHRALHGLPKAYTVTVGGWNLVMLRIPPGTFMMGSPDSERGRNSSEGPQHQVTISKYFYLGKYEVTQAQWQAVMGTPMPTTCGDHAIAPNFPVYCVSWDEIRGPGGFIDRLNAQLQTTRFRLPTEAEWEWAARAGTSTRFSHGDVLECGDGCQACAAHDANMWWCGNNEANGAKPVGRRQANAWGLFDMHGNVREWVQDFFHNSYTGAPTDGSAWETPASTWRMVRGGSSFTEARACRSAYRYQYRPDDRFDDRGFRLASW